MKVQRLSRTVFAGDLRNLAIPRVQSEALFLSRSEAIERPLVEIGDEMSRRALCRVASDQSLFVGRVLEVDCVELLVAIRGLDRTRQIERCVVEELLLARDSGPCA